MLDIIDELEGAGASQVIRDEMMIHLQPENPNLGLTPR